MGAARKLQAEIDRTLKKVQEGIVEFDQIWEKVYETESQSQREKYEGDLKKEIKKLQRLRDQIKTWIAGSDIKDKTLLMEARKNIEKEMERFKHCEKEAKTKAFSKVGLGQAAKLDPEEKARQSAREWLNEQVEALQMKVEAVQLNDVAGCLFVQIDEFEAELEGLNGTKRGRNRNPRQQLLEGLVVRHKSHIARLEQCMRCLDNSTITHEEIEDLKDMVEYYVGDSEEDGDGFDCVDETYAPLLDRLDAVATGLQCTTMPTRGKKASDLEEEQAEREREKERAAAAAVKAQLQAHGSNAATVLEEEKKSAPRTVPVAANAAAQPVAKRRMSLSEVPSGNHLGEELEGGSPVNKSGVLASSVKSETANGSLSFASAAAGRNATATPPAQRTATVWDAPKGKDAPTRGDSIEYWLGKGEDGEFPKLVVHQESLASAEKTKSLELPSEMKPTPKRSLDAAAVLPSAGIVNKAVPTAFQAAPPTPPPPVQTDSPEPTEPKTLGFKAAVLGSTGAAAAGSSEPPAEVSDPLLSSVSLTDLISHLGMSCSNVSSIPVVPGPFEENPAAGLQLLQACGRRSMPQPVDGDYRKQLSQNTNRSMTQQLPASFPVHRLPLLEDPNFYQELDIEGLFYAFYFLPEDIAQYYAAQELRRQSWRYHVEHNAWFRRWGEPESLNKDYEEGSYVYFDKAVSGGGLPGDGSETAMNGWCFRKKDNFVFRYEHLEDELH